MCHEASVQSTTGGRKSLCHTCGLKTFDGFGGPSHANFKPKTVDILVECFLAWLRVAILIIKTSTLERIWLDPPRPMMAMRIPQIARLIPKSCCTIPVLTYRSSAETFTN